MPVRFLSDAELARLSGWPDEIADEVDDRYASTWIPVNSHQAAAAKSPGPTG
jgi:hypothetical protein